MADLIWVLSQLTDLHGNIKIDGLNELVAPITDEEIELYHKIDFDVVSFLPLSYFRIFC